MPAKQYEVGTPVWADLLSSDMEAATRFYGGLFGWGANDSPMPDGTGVYRMFEKDGQLVGGLGELTSEMASQGVPSAWTLYIGGSADEAARRAQDAGGQVALGPADITDSGRLAVLTDPGGAAIGVWEAGKHQGFGVAGEPGSLVWAEVNTRSYDQCRRFYPAVFGWDTEDMPMPGTRYTVWKNGDDQIGGMLEMDDEQWKGIPPHWMLYFGVDDTDAAAARITELGGAVAVEPFDTPYGRLAVARDPTGAAFTVIRPPDQQPG